MGFDCLPDRARHVIAEGERLVAWTYEQILDNYPGLTREDILACLSYACDALHAEKIYPLAESGKRAAVGE